MQQTLEGLWDEWTDPSSDITRKTYTILTTSANPTMARIHNNPKASEEPRVPLILPKGLELDWLKPINHKVDMDFIESLIQPYDEEELDTFTVKRLSGHREHKARYFRLPTELLIIHNP